LALLLVQRSGERQLLLDPAAADVLLEHPLAEAAGALVGVLLGTDELARHLRRRRCPAQAEPRHEGLRRRPELGNRVRPQGPEARRPVALEAQLAVGNVLDDQEAVAPR